MALLGILHLYHGMSLGESALLQIEATCRVQAAVGLNIIKEELDLLISPPPRSGGRSGLGAG